MARRRSPRPPREWPRPHRLAVYWRSVGDDAGRRCCELLVPAGVLRLNATAARVWDLVDGRRDEARIAAALAADFPGADPAELRAAVTDLLDRLERLGAVVRDWTPLDPSRSAIRADPVPSGRAKVP
jgi:hypothetical protein